MIGSGLKKLASEYGMKVASGVAYGSFDGYVVTMSEGAGYKQIAFAIRFPDPAKKAEFLDAMGETDVRKLYRVQNFGVSLKSILVVFSDNPGTMKKIREFLAWFVPMLKKYGATESNICSECGSEVDSGRWILVDGIAYHFHDSCADKVIDEIQSDNTRRKKEATGSYVTGAVGAFLGSALGAAVWAFVLSMGYVASIIGLLIGWLSDKGYNLLKGKQGKAKVLILILAVIFGVLLGTLGGDVLSLIGMINDGELAGFATSDIPWMLQIMWQESAEYRSGVITNVVIGMLFAAFGVWALLRRAGKEVADCRVVELK